MGLMMSNHAVRRMQQRGIEQEELEMVLAWGREVPVGDGASSLVLGRRELAELVAEGAVSPSAADRLGRLAAVVSGSQLVTLIVLHGRRARRYWRRD